MRGPGLIAPLAAMTVAAVLGGAVAGSSPTAADPVQRMSIRLPGEPAERYGDDGLPSRQQEQLAAELSERFPHLAFSTRLARAAAACAAIRPRLAGAEIPHALLRFVVQWAGCPDPEVAVATVDTTRPGTADVWNHLETGLLGDLQRFSHLGMARVAADGDPYDWRWGVVVSRRRCRVEGLPRRVEAGVEVSFSFVLSEGLRDPEVLLQDTSGTVRRHAAERGEEGWTAALTPGSVPGTASVEVVASSRLGPEVVALMSVAVGRELRSIWTGAPPPDESGIVGHAEAEDLLERLLASTRRAHGLPPLERDVRLDHVARRHSVEMRERGYVAHVSPAGDGLGDRLAEAGYRVLRSAENIARNPSVHDAHRAMLDSPVHRARILATDMSRVGIGVAVEEAGERVFLVTEVFAEPLRQRSPEAVREAVRARMAATRRDAGLAPLRLVAPLGRAADAVARQLASGSIGGDDLARAVRPLLDDEDVGWRRLWVESLRFTDSGDVPAVTGAREPDARRAGIGVASAGATGGPVTVVVVLVAP